jgi:hypothetical protein
VAQTSTGRHCPQSNMHSAALTRSSPSQARHKSTTLHLASSLTSIVTR